MTKEKKIDLSGFDEEVTKEESQLDLSGFDEEDQEKSYSLEDLKKDTELLAEDIGAVGTGGTIGLGLGKLGQKGIEKSIDVAKDIDAAKILSKMPGGRFDEDTLREITKNKDIYKYGPEIPELSKTLGESAEAIKQKSYEKEKALRKKLKRSKGKLGTHRKLQLLSKKAKEFSEPLKKLSTNPSSTESKMLREQIRQIGEYSDDFSARDIIEDLTQKLESPDIDIKEKEKIKKSLKGYISNVPEELTLIKPELKEMRVPEGSKIRGPLEKLTEDVKGSVTEKESILKEYRRLRKEGEAAARKAKPDKQRFMAETAREYRELMEKQAPGSKKLLEESGQAITDKDLMKDVLKLKEIEGEPIISTKQTQTVLENIAKDSSKFASEMEQLTDVLKRNNLESLIPELKMASARYYAENAKLPDKHWVYRFLASGVAYKVGGPELAGAVGTAGAGTALYGTKMQAKLAASEMDELLQKIKGSKITKTAGKGAKKLAKAMPLIGAALGIGLGTAAKVYAEDKPFSEAVKEATFEEGAETIIPGGIDPLGPKKYTDEMKSMIGSKFEEEAREVFQDPQRALEMGEDLSEGQKLALERMKKKTQIESQRRSSKIKALNDYTFKNKVTKLENDDIDILKQRIVDLDQPAAQVYLDDLEEAKNSTGAERNSKLFNLLQQPAFRAMIKKNQEELKDVKEIDKKQKDSILKGDTTDLS